MTAGSATVNTTAVTANSVIFLTRGAGGQTAAVIRVASQTVGAGFTIKSSASNDGGVVNWIIFN